MRVNCRRTEVLSNYLHALKDIQLLWKTNNREIKTSPGFSVAEKGKVNHNLRSELLCISRTLRFSEVIRLQITNITMLKMMLCTLDLVLIPGYAITVVVGLVGNTLILTVVKKKRYMHTTTNFLLADLALADLFTLLWCIPGIALQYVTHPDGVLGDILCKFVTMHHLAGISLLLAGTTLALVSVERYNALLNPLNVSLRLTQENVKYPIARRICVLHWEKPSSTVYFSMLAILATAAFLVVCFCYFNIIRGLYFTKKICAEYSTRSLKAEEIQAKWKIAKLSITITIIFIACFFPFVIASVIDVSITSTFYRVALFLVYCSCCVNPICYALQSSNYRTAFRETIRKRSAVTKETEQAV